jgi:putative ATP-binding cassette transporter
LPEKNSPEAWKQILRFCVLAAIYIVMAVYAFYLNQMLQIRWRRWMTDRYLKEWLADRVYYRMQLTGSSTDNPDQRIAEDLKFFVEYTLTLSLGFLDSVVTLVSFVGILWAVSGPLPINFGSFNLVIPGYMVWAALLYAGAGSWLTHILGKPLSGLNFDKQRYEADFRFGLIRFRENAESVALYRGEQDELKSFGSRFANVVQNWWQIMRRQKILMSFRVGYNQAAVVFPFIVGLPRYLSGSIQLGGLMQISNAFGQVQGALSWFIMAYPLFAEWKATTDRLLGFHYAIERAREENARADGVQVTENGGENLSIEGISLALPNGEKLLAPSSANIGPGERVLIRGPSGSGKSTLFRAIAGIWPFGSGRLARPRNFKVLFLPQRPYLPIGTLKQVVTYPDSEESYTDEQARQALEACSLSRLAPRLNEARHWALELSPGEQQRIAFARALLIQPAWLFLDEATSAVDEALEERLYALLEQRLANTTIISIGHRPALQRFHARQLELKENGQGLRELQPA